MLPIRHILVPTDCAELSNRAFRLAATLAGEYDAQMIILYVVPLATMMYGPPAESYRDHLRKELCRMRPSDPGIHIEYLMAEGDPAPAILRVARETHSDLIVMGTHGRTGLNRLLIGSVAEEVVRKAPCLVLTVNSEVPADMIA